MSVLLDGEGNEGGPEYFVSLHDLPSLQCVEYLGANCFTVEQYKKMVTIIKVRLSTSFTRAKDRFEKRHDEDYDEEVEEDLQEEDKEDEQYLSKVGDGLEEGRRGEGWGGEKRGEGRRGEGRGICVSFSCKVQVYNLIAAHTLSRM